MKVYFSQIKKGGKWVNGQREETDDYHWCQVLAVIDNGITANPPVVLGWNNFIGVQQEDVGKELTEVYESKGLTEQVLLEEWTSVEVLMMDKETGEPRYNDEGGFMVTKRFMHASEVTTRTSKAALQAAGKRLAEENGVTVSAPAGTEGARAVKPETLKEG